MGRDERSNRENRLMVLESVRGHDSTVAHAWDHTGGRCPKCGCPNQAMFFCFPGQTVLPRLRSCELEGEHVHRLCSSCHYPWIERPLDKTMLADAQGDVTAESELAAMLAAMVQESGGMRIGAAALASYRGWILHIERDGEAATITVTSRPPEAQKGQAAHPGPNDVQGGGDE